MALQGKIQALFLRMLAPITARLDDLASRTQNIEAQLTRLAETPSEDRFDRLQESIGRIAARQTEQLNKGDHSFRNHEFKVFSQWGEDGLIQFLISRIDLKNRVFVEFGVDDYREANTRFLLVNNNWTGLVIDSNKERIDALRRSSIAWRHNLRATHAFITRDNINQLISDAGIAGEIGLLSIDIDGNDYWVWEAIEQVSPVIVVIEYNHRFGNSRTVTIPYDEEFRRGEKYPKIYYGASLGALCHLGNQKDYAFLGCNSNGVNAFFVRRDRLTNSISEQTVAEGYVRGTFTETLDETGAAVPVNYDEEARQALNLPLVDVTKKIRTS